MKKVLCILLVVTMIGCSKEMEDPRTNQTDVECRFTDEQKDCLVQNLFVSVNECTGQIHVIIETDFGDGTWEQWGMDLDQSNRYNDCITHHFNGGHTEPFVTYHDESTLFAARQKLTSE